MSTDPIETLESDAVEAAFNAAADWTIYDGKLVTHSIAGSAIYLIMWGQRHWVPDLPTLRTLFQPDPKVEINDHVADDAPLGRPLDHGSFIARGTDGPAEYLISIGRKFRIPDLQVRAKFQFGPYVTIPTLALDFISSGRDVS